MTEPTAIRVSAGLVRDPAGRVLLVRKRGTSAFMQPGGKPEPGESSAATLSRELAEEIGLALPVARMQPLGVFRANAANEPGVEVIADSFIVDLTALEAGQVRRCAEIEDLLWLDPHQPVDVVLAPLTRDHLLPLCQ